MIVTCMVALSLSGVWTPMKLTGRYLNISTVICKHAGGPCQELTAIDFTTDLTRKNLNGKVTGVQHVNFNDCVVKVKQDER